MDDNDDERQQIELTMPMIRQKKRLKSQILLPTADLMPRKLTGYNMTVAPLKKRRTASEQINRRDR